MKKIINKIQEWAEENRWETKYYFANTGSEYLTLFYSGKKIVVRVSDHEECYPPDRGIIEQFSISPKSKIKELSWLKNILLKPEEFFKECDKQKKKESEEFFRRGEIEEESVFLLESDKLLENSNAKKRSEAARVVAKRCNSGVSAAYRVLQKTFWLKNSAGQSQ